MTIHHDQPPSEVIRVARDCELGAPAREVWALVGDFDGLIESFGLEVESKGHGIGQTRTVHTGAIRSVERLELLDDQSMELSYSIIGGDVPVVGYVATMRVSESGFGRTRLEWSSTFRCAAGSEESEVGRFIAGNYKGAMAHLQERFGS